MVTRKLLFIDRDGTLIHEPPDYQIDSLDKFALEPHVIPALLQLKQANFEMIMVSNQDGLGTDSFPEEQFIIPQQHLLNILASQGIEFKSILICPHTPHDGCRCRKPELGLVLPYLQTNDWDRENSYVIGDRQTDIELAKNMGIQSLRYHPKPSQSNDTKTHDWLSIAHLLSKQPRQAQIVRQTRETQIEVFVDLDNEQSESEIVTHIGFFDHMLAQLAKHGGFYLRLNAVGDLHIDEHHLVEDTALTLGQALRQALGTKQGIARYGFLLPMDDALCQVALDLSGRSYFKFEGQFPREQIGTLPTELISHFFHSLSDTLSANLHIQVTGSNTHHIIESLFKAVGRAFRMAKNRVDDALPSTKGVL